MDVPATRTELFARRGQIDLSCQGRDLLKEKRTLLRAAFDRLSTRILEATATLEEHCSRGRLLLGETVAIEGPEPVASAGLAAVGEVEIERRVEHVAGVSLEHVDRSPVRRPPTERGYALATTSARIDAVAEAFEHQVELLLDVVAVELSLRRLADEIAVTTRRVNALEHVLIPRLEAERHYIEMVLEEREMEDHVRLLRARGHRDRRREEETT